jgi:hypothetical protein
MNCNAVKFHENNKITESYQELWLSGTQKIPVIQNQSDTQLLAYPFFVSVSLFFGIIKKKKSPFILFNLLPRRTAKL